MNTISTVELVLADGVVKQIQQRLDRGDGVAIIDWINFSVHESTFFRAAQKKEDQFLAAVAAAVHDVFGFVLGDELLTGRNFYARSWALGPKAIFGFLGNGGQANTVGFTVTGQGCLCARDGWESRLHKFLIKADSAQISRIDLAHDDFLGERFCIENVIHGFHRGFFNNGGRPPKIELRGNHIRPDGRGRSVYIGSRENMLLRAYEKGRQLGDHTSNWIRIEVEIHSSLRLLPFEILISPGQYLAATYPFLHGLSAQQIRLEAREKIQTSEYNQMKNWLRHQCGAALSLMVAVEGKDAAFEFLQKDFRAKAQQIFLGLAMQQAEETEPTSVITPTEE